VGIAGPYAEILRQPGAARFTAAAFIARLPISMVGLGIVLMVSAVRGSYALAGVIAAAYTVSSALLNPLGSRAVDRWGQRRVVRLLVLVHVAGLIGLAFATVKAAPGAVLVLLAVLAGSTQPATGALVRARWAHLLGSDRRLRTAFAFEGVLDEFIFVVGPRWLPSSPSPSPLLHPWWRLPSWSRPDRHCCSSSAARSHPRARTGPRHRATRCVGLG
jgi:MFS family permease